MKELFEKKKNIIINLLPVVPILNHLPYKYYDMQKDYQQEMIESGYDDGPIESKKEYIESIKKIGKDYRIEIISFNKCPVGFICYSISDCKDGLPPVMLLHQLYIKKEFRLKGMGTLAVYSIVDQFENIHLWFCVNKANTIAHSFWDSLVNKGILRHVNDERCSTKDDELFINDDNYVLKKIALC